MLPKNIAKILNKYNDGIFEYSILRIHGIRIVGDDD